MATTIDYSDDVTPQYVIQIPRADMLDVTAGGPTEIRQLNINEFRRVLDDLMDDMIGMAFETTHEHTPPLTVAGVTLARVLEILDPYVIEFEDGLYNVNIVGGNSNISDVTVKNQVGVNTANSAGLQDPFALQAAAFAGEVAVDVNALVSGTTFPFGTRSFPVNNVTHALTIAQVRGIRTLRILSAMTLASGDFSETYKFRGDSQNVLLTLADAPDVANCEFCNLGVTGTLDGNNSIRGAFVGDLNYVDGFIHDSVLGSGTITLSQAASAHLVNCRSGTPGAGPPVIDMGGSGSNLNVQGYEGELKITNLTSPTEAAEITITGHLTIDSSVTAGTITVLGMGKLTDNSTGTAVVNSENFVSKEGIAFAVWATSLGSYAAQDTMGGSQLMVAYLTQEGFAISLCSEHGVPGTVVGENGTFRNPVDNLADALVLAAALQIRTLVMDKGSFTLPEEMKHWRFYGEDPTRVTIDINGQDVSGATFYRCGVGGIFGSAEGPTAIVATECLFGTSVNLTGFFVGCGFSDDIYVGVGSVAGAGALYLINCKTISAGATFHFSDTYPQDMATEAYSGNVTFVGCGHAATTIRFSGNGEITIDSTCVAGSAELSGDCESLTDNSGPSFTVDKDALFFPIHMTELHRAKGLEKGNPITYPTQAEPTLEDENGTIEQTGEVLPDGRTKVTRVP